MVGGISVNSRGTESGERDEELFRVTNSLCPGSFCPGLMFARLHFPCIFPRLIAPHPLVFPRYFPNGELDDGGGALPPPSAGLVASQAEEERTDSLDAEFLRVDAWAKSLALGNWSAPWWQAASAAAAIARAKLQRTLGSGGGSTPLMAPLVAVTEEDEEEGEGSAAKVAASISPLREASPRKDEGVAGAAEAAPLVCLADQLASVCGGSQVRVTARFHVRGITGENQLACVWRITGETEPHRNGVCGCVWKITGKTRPH